MIQVVCFSRNRPLQLHGYLGSLYRWWSGAREDVSVGVLARIEYPYEAAYAAVQAEFPQVQWRRETDFAQDLHVLLESTDEPYRCFGCDDVVWVGAVQPQAIDRAFRNDPQILGFSFRLGLNVEQGMWGQPMQYPELTPARGYLKWDLDHPGSKDDWAYPWEVLGTVYRANFVRKVMAGLDEPGNPSQLEERASRLWSGFTDARTMAASRRAPLVVPTVNVVQEEFPNGVVGRGILTPELLLQCWQQGLRLDHERFSERQYTSWRVPDFYLKRAE